MIPSLVDSLFTPDNGNGNAASSVVVYWSLGCIVLCSTHCCICVFETSHEICLSISAKQHQWNLGWMNVATIVLQNYFRRITDDYFIIVYPWSAGCVFSDDTDLFVLVDLSIDMRIKCVLLAIMSFLGVWGEFNWLVELFLVCQPLHLHIICLS